MKKLLHLLVITTLFAAARLPAETTSGLVADGATLQRLPGEYQFTEGPAADPHGNVFFTDQPNNRIVKWKASGGTVEDWLKPAGRSNGLFFDSKGNLIACADEKNELWSIAPDKKIKVLIEAHEGKLLNGPNDLWIRPDGGLYFTDPLYARSYWKRDKAIQQDGQHVYFLQPGATNAIPVETGLKQPNGIIGTPNGKTLYVADIGDGKTYSYTIQPNGSLTDKQLFCEMGSDGMTIDEKGNIYLTGQGVTVFDPKGQRIEQIAVPEGWTANVTFGGPDRKLLFITASKGIYGLQMNVTGAPRKAAPPDLD